MPAVNDIFIASVRDVTSEGAGVVEHDSGQVFFVPGVWRGETGRFQVTGFRKRNGFARLLELIEPSPQRLAPACPHHGFSASDCGGCPWQFMAIEAQLQQKEERVRRAMERLGAADRVRPIWASPRQFGYRNRAQFKTDGVRLGYVSANSNRIAAIRECPILTEPNRATLADLLATLPRPEWRPPRKQPWVTLDIDEEVTAASVQVNRRRPFRQGNDFQNGRMGKWLAQALAGADNRLPALELFAGSGNFTRVIASRGFPQVIAIEGVGEAVAALQKLGLSGVEPQVVNLFDEAAVAKVGRASAAVGTLVLDPPRDGFHGITTLLSAMVNLRRIIYISCDLATFTRDMECVLKHGFGLEEVQPLDMFPHTPHVEIMALASRRE